MRPVLACRWILERGTPPPMLFSELLKAELPVELIDVDKLNALVGKYVNLEYTLPNGEKVKFLDDQKTYLGNQMESEFGGDKCFGILTSMDFILLCTYEKDGENPELLIYKKR